MLGQGDVDLGFTGRHRGEDPIHQLLPTLRYGDELRLVIRGNKRELHTPQGRVVGKLAAAMTLPEGHVVRVAIECIIRRSRTQTKAEFQRMLRVDAWWVVLPSIVIEPAPNRRPS
jgi:hypothetical protein